MMRKTFSKGGIHPDDKKLSKDCSIEAIALPQRVYIPISQHIGAPAKTIVKVGDKVKVGQIIAEPIHNMSAFVHSSVSGTVKSISMRKDLAMRAQTCVEILVEGDEWLESIDRSSELNIDIPQKPEEIIEKIRLAGIVGLGGATFPTHVKLSIPEGKKCEYLLINACECEPYLTSDYRTLLERGAEVLVGIAILKQALSVSKVVIGVEDNKEDAIAYIRTLLTELRQKSSIFEGISIMALKVKYPEGGEKQLINAVLSKEVPSGGLPIDIGVVVQNVCTALAVYEAVQKNKPLIDNSITITGDCLPVQANFLVRIGTPIQYLVDLVGGIPDEAVKIISGGPMMGRAIANLDASTVKGTSALLFLTRQQTERKSEGPCIRCSKCADACPIGLEPFLLNKLGRKYMMDELEENAVQDCIECGSCLYVCPSHIPLLDMIRVSKGQVLSLIRIRQTRAVNQ